MRGGIVLEEQGRIADRGKLEWEWPALIRLDVDRETYGGGYPNVHETGHVAATTHFVLTTTSIASDVFATGLGVIS